MPGFVTQFCGTMVGVDVIFLGQAPEHLATTDYQDRQH